MEWFQNLTSFLHSKCKTGSTILILFWCIFLFVIQVLTETLLGTNDYNSGHILAIYCVSVHAWFATSKTGRDIYYDRLCMWVASRVTGNRLILGISQNSMVIHSSAPSPLLKWIFGKRGQKLHKSRYQSFLVLPDFAWFFFLFLQKYFVQSCSNNLIINRHKVNRQWW